MQWTCYPLQHNIYVSVQTTELLLPLPLHPRQDKMDTISQTTVSNAFSRMIFGGSGGGGGGWIWEGISNFIPHFMMDAITNQ